MDLVIKLIQYTFTYLIGKIIFLIKKGFLNSRIELVSSHTFNYLQQN